MKSAQSPLVLLTAAVVLGGLALLWHRQDSAGASSGPADQTADVKIEKPPRVAHIEHPHKGADPPEPASLQSQSIALALASGTQPQLSPDRHRNGVISAPRTLTEPVATDQIDLIIASLELLAARESAEVGYRSGWLHSAYTVYFSDVNRPSPAETTLGPVTLVDVTQLDAGRTNESWIAIEADRHMVDGISLTRDAAGTPIQVNRFNGTHWVNKNGLELPVKEAVAQTFTARLLADLRKAAAIENTVIESFIVDETFVIQLNFRREHPFGADTLPAASVEMIGVWLFDLATGKAISAETAELLVNGERFTTYHHIYQVQEIVDRLPADVLALKQSN